MNENELVTLLGRGWDCCTRLTVASDPHDIVTDESPRVWWRLSIHGG